MLLAAEAFGDVTRLVLASPTSRLVGYTASVYVADTDVGPVLVDTGFPFAWRALRGYLESRGGGRGAVRSAVRGAVVTHRHEDHAGNLARLAAAGVPVAMADATRAAVARVAPIALYRRYTWGAMDPLPPEAPAFDPAPLVLVPTPGHTSDHHAVWDTAVSSPTRSPRSRPRRRGPKTPSRRWTACSTAAGPTAASATRCWAGRVSSGG